MFDHKVLVVSNDFNRKLLKRQGLKFGIDYRSESGAVEAGRQSSLCLKFKDLNKAMIYKLQTRT
jgi:hypothetical protein